MPHSNLHKRISELEIQNQELLAENKRLREMLGLPKEKISPKDENIPSLNFIEEESIPTSSINKYSLPEEKIELFISLFQGRTDVYAKRCYSKKHDSHIIFQLAGMNVQKGYVIEPALNVKTVSIEIYCHLQQRSLISI